MNKGSFTPKQSVAGRWMLQAILIFGVIFLASPAAPGCARQRAQSELPVQIRLESEKRSFRLAVFSLPAAEQTTLISGNNLYLFSHLHFTTRVKLKVHQHTGHLPRGKFKTGIFLLHHSSGDDPDAG